jgi:hypothetical protein
MRLKKNPSQFVQGTFFGSGIRGILSGVLVVATVGCSGETTDRRSAVDTGRLCNSESKTSIAGACLERGSNISGGGTNLPVGDPPPATVGDPPPAPGGDPAQGPAGNSPPSSSGNPAAGSGGIPASGSGGDPLPAGGGNPVAASGGNPLPASGGNPAPSAPTTRTLLIKQDSFVAVADTTVAKNCFIPAGTKIEFSGDLAQLTQFKALGVNQNIAYSVVSVTPASGKTVGCELKGSDFVYLVAHADVAANP